MHMADSIPLERPLPLTDATIKCVVTLKAKNTGVVAGVHSRGTDLVCYSSAVLFALMLLTQLQHKPETVGKATLSSLHSAWFTARCLGLAIILQPCRHLPPSQCNWDSRCC
jgi:hypothetical protein